VRRGEYIALNLEFFTHWKWHAWFRNNSSINIYITNNNNMQKK